MKVFVLVDDDSSLFPAFLDHYRSLGCSKFIVGIRGDPSDAHFAFLHKFAQLPDVEIERTYTGMLDCFKELEWKQRLLSRYVDFTEWIIVADLDEFHEYPRQLTDLIRRLDDGGYSCMMGWMLDRVAEDGSLLPYDPRKPIWQQYPWGLHFTREIAGACINKVMLMRGPAQLRMGHHFLADAHVYPEHGIVHHFKWNSTALKRLERRKLAYSSAGVHWADESDRFLSNFRQTGKIDTTEKRFYRRGRLRLDIPQHSQLQPPLPPREISFNIMTVHREPEYVFQTLASLFTSGQTVHNLGEIQLIEGSSDGSYLRTLEHHRRL
jgi:hypothetical protein